MIFIWRWWWRLILLLLILILIRLVIRFWMIFTLMMGFWNVSLSCRTVNIALVVTSSDVFIEICSVSTVESVLLSVMVAKMINLL